MTLSSIGASIPVENLNSIYGDQRKLESGKPINLQDIANQRQINSENIKINSNIDLSNTSNLTIKEDSVKIKLYGDYDNNSSREFESLINWMDLSKDQKTMLQNAVNAASDTLNNQRDGNTYGLRIAQTNMEFKYISQKLVPKEYQDKFNSVAEKYIKNSSDDFLNFEKGFAQNLMDRTDSLSTQMGWQKKGKEWMESIENGTDDFQASEKRFVSYYNNIDFSDSGKVKDQLDNVYKNILSNGGNSYNKSDLSREIKYLSEKWNGVMDAIGDKNNKFTTSVNYMV